MLTCLTKADSITSNDIHKHHPAFGSVYISSCLPSEWPESVRDKGKGKKEKFYAREGVGTWEISSQIIPPYVKQPLGVLSETSLRLLDHPWSISVNESTGE